MQSELTDEFVQYFVELLNSVRKTSKKTVSFRSKTYRIQVWIQKAQYQKVEA
jgi:hypothetical protein